MLGRLLHTSCENTTEIPESSEKIWTTDVPKIFGPSHLVEWEETENNYNNYNNKHKNNNKNKKK